LQIYNTWKLTIEFSAQFLGNSTLTATPNGNTLLVGIRSTHPIDSISNVFGNDDGAFDAFGYGLNCLLNLHLMNTIVIDWLFLLRKTYQDVNQLCMEMYRTCLSASTATCEGDDELEILSVLSSSFALSPVYGDMIAYKQAQSSAKIPGNIILADEEVAAAIASTSDNFALDGSRKITRIEAGVSFSRSLMNTLMRRANRRVGPTSLKQ